MRKCTKRLSLKMLQDVLKNRRSGKEQEAVL